MLRITGIFLIASAAILLLAGASLAQEPAPPPPPMGMHLQAPEPGFIGERIELLGFEGDSHHLVKGAPFSAVAVSETTQTLADGNRIHRTTQTALFRDSQGRTRREATLPAIGPLAFEGNEYALKRSFTSIHDPVSGVSYILEPEQKVARKLPAPVAGEINFRKEGFIAKGMTAATSNDLKTESLGTQTINGVTAEGTRYTRTIPAGQIGNEQPIIIVSERWYSSDLQIVVMSKRSDPRFGETTYQLANLQRSEPAASLFQVPADYTIQEEGPGRRGHLFHRPVPAPAPQPDF